ncbi:MAG TPA: zinc-ribbon domain-containing protein [Terriglobia bacterium]|nr:zinc-ribbon domain-containing protein [Terriglobia bacterium]
MFCPKCGKETGEGDAFCRSCGFSLGVGSHVSATQAGTADTTGKSDKWVGVRVVILITFAMSIFTLPWAVTTGIGLIWVILLVMPQ